MRETKGFVILEIKIFFTLLITVLALTLNGCGQESSQNQSSNDTFSAPLPKELKALSLDKDTLLVQVVVDGGTPQTCTGLTVDTGAGTYSCNITLPAGSHTISLVYSVIDTAGTFIVATTSDMDVTVTAGQTSTPDLSALTEDYNHDNDSDGKNNITELDEGSDLTVKSYYIGGTVTGLFGTGAVLVHNGVNLTLTVTGNDSFKFIPAVVVSTSYTVTVSTQPSSPNQTCTVTNGIGTVSTADVETVEVICSCILDSSEIGKCTLE